MCIFLGERKERSVYAYSLLFAVMLYIYNLWSCDAKPVDITMPYQDKKIWLGIGKKGPK